MTNAKPFKRIVVLDNLLLFEEHRTRLGGLGEEVVHYASSTPETIREVVRARDKGSKFGLLGDSESPQCATELGIEQLAEQELAGRVNGADCVLTCWTGIPASIIEQNPQLKYIGFWTHDKNKIGVPEAEAKGIKVTYVPDYGTTAVAELVFSGVLNLARRIREHEKTTLRGEWPYEQFKKGAKAAYDKPQSEYPAPDDIKEFTLEGKTLGIIGMGRIGQKVAHMAKHGFGMDVLYFSRARNPEIEKQGYKFADINQVMGSDVVSVHLPPNAPGNLIDAEKISLIRDGSVFVNTSVGHVVDQESLLAELKTGRFYAFLDVYDGLPPRKELKELRNVLATYRAGWYTRDSVRKKGDLFMSHLLEYVNSIKQ